MPRLRWRGLLLALGALILAGIAGYDAALSVLSRSSPSLALSIGPTDARTLQRVAEDPRLAGSLAGTGLIGPSQIRSALYDMPLSARLLRYLATVDEGQENPAQSARLLAISGQVSRRDFLGEILLADAAARADDAPRAMMHINAALSTSRNAADLVFPFLLQLLSDPSFRPIIAQYVEQPWGDEFLYFAAQRGVAADALEVALSNAVVQKEARYARFNSELITHLIDEGRTVQAFDYVERLKGPETPLLVEPGFSQATVDPASAPLSWALTNADGIYADLGGSSGVVLSADAGARGIALQRVLKLAPGSWQLRAERTVLQRVDLADAEWQFSCSSAGSSSSLGSADIPLTGQPVAAIQARFTLPSSCPAVRISLFLHNLDDQKSLDLELSKLTIVRSAR